MKYIIHGATVAQGAPLFNKLIAEGKNAIAAVRNIEILSGKPIVSIVVDLASVDSLVDAYLGVEGIFVFLPFGPEPDRYLFARNIAKAISIAKPSRVVVSTSGWSLGIEGHESALPTLIKELEAIDCSLAVIAPQLYLENLLLPMAMKPVNRELKLPYPLSADYPVSWCSHLDIADVAAALLTNKSISGIVEVGQLPAMTGDELAAAFSKHVGYTVTFDNLTPDAFGEMFTTLFGETVASEVAGGYKTKVFRQSAAIDQQRSAQKLLGIEPRTVREWLAQIGI